MDMKILAEQLGMIRKVVGAKTDDIEKDIKDLRAAVKAIVQFLKASNDEERDLVKRDFRLMKRREKFSVDQFQKARDLWPLAVGRERVYKG